MHTVDNRLMHVYAFVNYQMCNNDYERLCLSVLRVFLLLLFVERILLTFGYA
jgi:hypothetical protein